MPPTDSTPSSGGLVLRNLQTFSQLGSVQREALAILGDKTLDDMAKSYATACAVQQFRSTLSDEKIMAPVMALQGNAVGFLTDKDKTGGYDVATVRDSVVTAMLLGFRLTGNEFNIISGRFYAAVNGCDRKFNEMCAEPPAHEPGEVDFQLDRKRGVVDYKITYRLKGDSAPNIHVQRVAVKLSFSRDGMLLSTDDAVIGKARRKVLWNLLRSVRGFDLGLEDGEIEKNVTPSADAPAARVTARANAARSAFAAGPTVDAQPGDDATAPDGGTQ